MRQEKKAADASPVIGSRYHMLLVNELDTVNRTPVGRQCDEEIDNISLSACLQALCDI